MGEKQQLLYNPSNDYYKLFGIASDASVDTVRQIYRQRAKEVHPDHNPQRKAWATQQFRLINEAYEVLSDSALRAEYDRQRYFYLFDAFEVKPPPQSRPVHNRTMWKSQRRRTMSPAASTAIFLAALIWLITQASSCSTSYHNYSNYDQSSYNNTSGNSSYGASSVNSGVPQNDEFKPFNNSAGSASSGSSPFGGGSGGAAPFGGGPVP